MHPILSIDWLIILACGHGPWRATAYFPSPFFIMSAVTDLSILLKKRVCSTNFHGSSLFVSSQCMFQDFRVWVVERPSSFYCAHSFSTPSFVLCSLCIPVGRGKQGSRCERLSIKGISICCIGYTISGTGMGQEGGLQLLTAFTVDATDWLKCV